MRRTTITFCVLALALSVGMPWASAQMVKVPVEGALVAGADGVPGIEWTTGAHESGSFQLRGATGTQWWEGSGYLAGTAQVVYNTVLALGCNDPLECVVTGRLWGTIVFHPDAYPGGGWEGAFTHRFTRCDEFACYYVGTLEASGFGELEGSLLRLDCQDYVCTGYVLTPGTPDA